MGWFKKIANASKATYQAAQAANEATHRQSKPQVYNRHPSRYHHSHQEAVLLRILRLTTMSYSRLIRHISFPTHSI